MTNYKFIYKNESEFIIGQVMDGRLVSYQDLNQTKLGQIYRARISKEIPVLNGYVVELGLDKDGLLKAKDSFGNIKPSDQVLVEVIQESDDQKMYRLSQKLSLSNAYVVITPYNKLKKSLTNQKYPYFLRTRGKDLTNDEIEFYYKDLEDEFERLVKERNMLPTPKLIRRSSRLDDFLLGDTKIVSNISFKGSHLIEVKKDFNPKYVKEISLDLAKSKNARVDGHDFSINIDMLEALTVIDINSKGHYKNLSKSEMALRVNVSSLEEIAIQISLRNIKKMLIIDFIRLSKSDKKILINNLVSVFNKYNIKHKIMGFSNMDFLEIILFWFDFYYEFCYTYRVSKPHGIGFKHRAPNQRE